MMEDGNPLKMKVTELKSELGKRGLSQTGLKFDLAQRLQTAMDVDEFGDLPSLARPTSSVPCLAPSSNPNGRPASSVDSCEDQTDSLLPVTAAVQGSPKQEAIAPQRSTAGSTCSTSSKANETFVTRRIHEGEISSLDSSPGESISVMWGGDGRSKGQPRTVDEEERVATSVTPTKRNKEPIGMERSKDRAEEDSQTKKIPCPGSAERTKSTPPVIEELCAEMVYQLETDESRGGDSERATSDPAKGRVEPATKNLVEIAEVPPLQCSPGRGVCTTRRKPRSNMGGTTETSQELDKAVIARNERRLQPKEDEWADAGERRTDERTDERTEESSGVASHDGCTDLVHTTPPNLSPGGTFFVSPFSEIDKMKDREQRFGQPNKIDHPDFSEPSCSGIDVHDDERCGSSRMEEGLRSEAAHSEVADTITANDTWKEKLLKRKARFETLPLDRSRMKMTSEPIREARSPAAGEAAEKMARRTERFAATSSGSSARLVTALTGTPDPRGGSFAPPESAKAVATPQKSTAAAGDDANDPLPQRRKRVRARNSALGSILAPAKRTANAAGAGKRSDEGPGTSANAFVKPFTVAGTPGKGSPETRGRTKTKKPMKQTVQFLPVVFTSDGGSFVERGCSPSPSPIPGVAALRSSSPPPSAISSSSTISPSVPLCLERPGVTPRPFSKKGHKTPMKRAGKGFMGKKAADQASKMRDRQKRFAQDSRTARESTSCG